MTLLPLFSTYLILQNFACRLAVAEERRYNNMYELVEVRRDDVFTNSKIIAEGTGNQHKNVREIIQKYEKVFEETHELGKVTFKTEVLPSGQKEKVYLLNEGQAMFLMTLINSIIYSGGYADHGSGVRHCGGAGLESVRRLAHRHPEL